MIHLAPQKTLRTTWDAHAGMRPATQNQNGKAVRRQSTECHRPCNVPLCPPRTRVHTTATASARSSHHGTMSNDTGQLPMLRAVSVTRDDASSLTSSMSKA